MKNNYYLFVKASLMEDCSVKCKQSFIFNCIKCNNFDYKIISSDGILIKDYENKITINTKIIIKQFLIETKDILNNSINLDEYLSSKGSEYKLAEQFDIIKNVNDTKIEKELGKVLELNHIDEEKIKKKKFRIDGWNF